MNRVFILHYHEIWLKGGNKNYFLSRLRSSLKQSLADLPVQSLESLAERFLLVPGDESAAPAILERLRRVLGLAYIASAREVPSSLADMGPVACALMEEKNPPQQCNCALGMARIERARLRRSCRRLIDDWSALG